MLDDEDDGEGVLHDRDVSDEVMVELIVVLILCQLLVEADEDEQIQQ